MIETEKTRELLDACKEAGYTYVAVLCADKLVPASVRARFASMTTGSNTPLGKTKRLRGFYWFAPGSTEDNELSRVVSAHPKSVDSPQLQGAENDYYAKGNHFPKLWGIVRNLGLAMSGSCGCGETHQVESLFIKDLTPGCYEL